MSTRDNMRGGDTRSDHLRPETLFGYEHRLLTPEELTALFAHTAQCADCRLALGARMDVNEMAADAHSLLASPPQSAVRQFPRYAAAAAALVVVSAAAFWYSRHPAAPTESPTVEQALRTGHVELPQFLGELRPQPQVLMGGPDAPPAQTLSPRGTAVAGLPVEFRWQPQYGDWTYQVRVFTLTGDPVTTSPEVITPHWSCQQDLKAGADYQWQVTAVHGSERVTLPGPSEAPPRFRVLDSASAERLRELARRQPVDHLLLGVEYARAGLLDDARVHLTEAARLAPGRPEILGLLHSLPLAK
jgi:hypothetical protein